MPTTGRITVAPGQTIASEWGNLVWDQSTQNFASTADRDTQWPAPHDGAICYTAADGAWWIRAAGAWQPLTRGFPSPRSWKAQRGANDSVGAGVFGTAVGVSTPAARAGAYLVNGVALVTPASNCWVDLQQNNVTFASYYTQNLGGAFAALPISGISAWGGGGTDVSWGLRAGFGSGGVWIWIGSSIEAIYLGPNV